MKDNKCIVHGCSNHADQGRFVGEMCSPCHTMITTGKVMPTDSFLNQITSLEAENEKLKNILRLVCVSLKLIDKGTSLEAENEKLKNILRKVFPEKSGHFFICGEDTDWLNMDWIIK